jgi:hypothetical protein
VPRYIAKDLNFSAITFAILSEVQRITSLLPKLEISAQVRTYSDSRADVTIFHYIKKNNTITRLRPGKVHSAKQNFTLFKPKILDYR